MTGLVVGAPAWDRAWSLPLWFQSVRANCDPADTGLVFVVPSADAATRDAIAGLSDGFGWVEVLRDRGRQSTREERPATNHETLVRARNQILRVVERAQPRHYLSWDTDFLVPEGAVDALVAKRLPLTTVWAWLNRQPPRRMRYYDGREFADVLVQDPALATAMRIENGRPRHYPGEQFLRRAVGTWPCDVALAFQLMDARAYRVASYRPHRAGEDVPFNEQLALRGIQRYCCGEILGVHLYDRGRRDEKAMGWPGVMSLAAQAPLAATHVGPRPTEWEAFGFYPVSQEAKAA